MKLQAEPLEDLMAVCPVLFGQLVVVRKWLGQGRMRGIKPGSNKTGWRIDEADLEAFIERRSNTLAPEETAPRG